MTKRRFLTIGFIFCLLAVAVGVFLVLLRRDRIERAQELARHASMSDLGDLLGDKDAYVRLAAVEEIRVRAYMASPIELAPALCQVIEDKNDEVVRLATIILEGLCSE